MKISEVIKSRRSTRTFDGTALRAFELAAKECGFEVSIEICDPSLPGQGELQYIASYVVTEGQS